jgi:uncharacterized phiE125 gp8 family phage protein
MIKIHTDILRVSGPTEHAIALANLKLHLKLGSSQSEDTLLNDDIDAACAYFEEHTGRIVTPATFDYVLDAVPVAREIELPYAPLVEVVSVSYLDGDGASQTFDAANYSATGIQARGRGRVVLTPDASWPTVQSSAAAVLTIRFTAGYADVTVSPLALDVPPLIAQAIRSLAAVFHKFRADVQDNSHSGGLQTVPIGGTSIIRAFQLPPMGDLWV